LAEVILPFCIFDEVIELSAKTLHDTLLNQKFIDSIHEIQAAVLEIVTPLNLF